MRQKNDWAFSQQRRPVEGVRASRVPHVGGWEGDVLGARGEAAGVLLGRLWAAGQGLGLHLGGIRGLEGLEQEWGPGASDTGSVSGCGAGGGTGRRLL